MSLRLGFFPDQLSFSPLTAFLMYLFSFKFNGTVGLWWRNVFVSFCSMDFISTKKNVSSGELPDMKKSCCRQHLASAAELKLSDALNVLNWANKQGVRNGSCSVKLNALHFRNRGYFFYSGSDLRERSKGQWVKEFWTFILHMWCYSFMACICAAHESSLQYGLTGTCKWVWLANSSWHLISVQIVASNRLCVWYDLNCQQSFSTLISYWGQRQVENNTQQTGTGGGNHTNNVAAESE